MGQVIRVNPTSSVALLLTDPSHGIPVEINRTGLQTVARGGGDGRVLTLPFLPGNADVKVGDLLVSSGLGGRFPAGYPVGEIFDIRRTTGEHFMEASAYPSARLNQGRQTLLVWSSAPAPVVSEDPTEAPASLAASAAASAQSWAQLPSRQSAASVAAGEAPLPPFKYGSAPVPTTAKTSPKPAAAVSKPKPKPAKPVVTAPPAQLTVPAETSAPVRPADAPQ